MFIREGANIRLNTVFKGVSVVRVKIILKTPRRMLLLFFFFFFLFCFPASTH